MNQTRPPRDAAALEAWHAANGLLHWLQIAAAEEPLLLPGLRTASPVLHGPYWSRHARAAENVFARADQAGRGEVYRGVAQLFAHYNRAPHGQQQLGFGLGSMGVALARLSRTEHDPQYGRSWLYLDACLRRRTRLPWRELTKACNSLRDRNVAPPDWRELIIDLTYWTRPRSLPERTPTVRERWSADLHTAYGKRRRP